MFLKLFFLYLPLVLINACSSTSEVIGKTKPSPQIVPPPFELPAGKVELRGSITLYDGSGRFQTCEGETLYWFSNNPKITQIYDSLGLKKGEPAYIEFLGRLNKSPDDFSDKFDAEVQFIKLHHMAKMRDTLACQRERKNEIAAFGLNDEWQAYLSADRISVNSHNGKWDIPASKVYVEVGGTRVWEGLNSNDNPIIVKIFQKDCRSKRTNAYWSYSSNYISGLTELGCADLPIVDTQTDFSGNYSGILPIDNRDVEFNISLNLDYSVTADFVYSDENDPIKQTGFWQPISDTQFSVTLVKKTNNKFLQQFLFDWDGEKISTKEQGLAGIAYPIKGEGLNMWMMDAPYAKGTKAVEQRSFPPQHFSFEKQANTKVEAALLNYFKINRTAPNGMNYNFNLFDLNGDGVKELIVLLNWCSSQGCTLLIFEDMGNKYRFVSRTTEVLNSLLLATGVDYKWQQLLARQGNDYVLLKYDGIGYPISTKGQPIASTPLPLAGIELFAEPEPPKWYHSLPK